MARPDVRAAACYLDADAGPDDQHTITEPQRHSDAVAKSIAIAARDALSDRDADADADADAVPAA